ncbi:MAG: triose-phosphate isomerase, partial [Thermoplasmatota archaeon]
MEKLVSSVTGKEDQEMLRNLLAKIGLSEPTGGKIVGRRVHVAYINMLGDYRRAEADAIIKKAGSGKIPPEDVAKLVLAYEPVWAIGTGKTATPRQAEEVHHYVRKLITQRAGEAVGQGIRILYGGSVNPKNAAEILALHEVDGALVGRFGEVRPGVRDALDITGGAALVELSLEPLLAAAKSSLSV